MYRNDVKDTEIGGVQKIAATPELKQQFVKDWNEQIYPRTAFINKNGKIEFLQPFVFIEEMEDYSKRQNNENNIQ